MLSRPATPAPTVCPRCQSPLGGERRQATGLDGRTICEPCQHQEMDELIEQLDRTSPGPARPANMIPVAERGPLASAGFGG